MRRLIILSGLLLCLDCGMAGVPEQGVTLPQSPPFAYTYWAWGMGGSDRPLSSDTVAQIRGLLSKELKKLPKPFSPGGADAFPDTPEGTIDIVNAKGRHHGQILLLPGVVIYNGDYATHNKDVIAKLKTILNLPKPSAKPMPRKQMRNQSPNHAPGADAGRHSAG